MKAQKSISILATLSILSFAVACNDGGGSDRYAEGFAAGKTAGYQEGYEKGYDDGDLDGYARAEAYFKTADYTQGYNDGRTVGLGEGYTQGYNVGKVDGYNSGYLVGWDIGFDEGYEDGEDFGYDEGWEVGYDDGMDAGLDIGFDIGWDAALDAYGLSVGPTKKLQGYASVLSAFHNDLIDYSKIKAPVQTKRGLVANGQLLLSEVSMTNKDTLKRAAVVEQYLVVEMSKQVKSKFGLSAERSLQIAKAANHFRKFSTTRALTAEDTNAYATEIVGVNFKKIEKAFEKSMKGDLSEMNEIMDQAAEKNGVSPEKMNQIVTKLFL